MTQERLRRAEGWLDRQEAEGDGVLLPGKWGRLVSTDYVAGLLDGFPQQHWTHLPLREVSLRQEISFCQEFVYPEVIRRRLWEDDEEYDEPGPGGPDPKFIVHDRQVLLSDGHHRFAEARLTGGELMTGRVFDTSDPSHSPRGCPACSGKFPADRDAEENR